MGKGLLRHFYRYTDSPATSPVTWEVNAVTGAGSYSNLLFNNLASSAYEAFCS